MIHYFVEIRYRTPSLDIGVWCGIIKAQDAESAMREGEREARKVRRVARVDGGSAHETVWGST